MSQLRDREKVRELLQHRKEERLRREQEAQLRRTDRALLAAIGALSLLTVLLLVPEILAASLWAWSWCRIVFDVRRWPFWIWTCIGVVVLTVLLWLRGQNE